MSYVIIAELEVFAEHLDRFITAIDRHAHNSRTLEEGCLIFDVCQYPDAPERFLLYEVYCDEAAYESHRKTASYAEFFDEVRPILVGKDGKLLQSRKVLSRRNYG